MEFDVKADPIKNRLYLRLRGMFSDENIKNAADQAIAAMRVFKGRPFTIVSDISEFKPLTQEGVEHVKRVGEEGLKVGLVATARVVGKSAVAKMQFERASHENGYPSYSTSTVEDAEAALDNHKG
jgi:hypothetical protein